MSLFQRERLKKISTLLEIPAPDPQQFIRRIKVIERDMFLPVKLLVVCGLILYFTRWLDVGDNPRDIAIQNVKQFILIYGLFNVNPDEHPYDTDSTSGSAASEASGGDGHG